MKPTQIHLSQGGDNDCERDLLIKWTKQFALYKGTMVILFLKKIIWHDCIVIEKQQTHIKFSLFDRYC